MVVAPFGNKPVGRTLYDVWSVISVKELYYQHMEAIGTPVAFLFFVLNENSKSKSYEKF